MSTVTEALTWSGDGADVSVFVAVPAGREAHLDLDLAVGDARPRASVFPMEQDVPRPLPHLEIVEFDAHFADLPADLAGYVTAVLQRALDAGAVVAWCGYEGSFHFDHLLTDDIAPQVYAVATPALGVRTALDDATLTGPGWTATLREARAASG